MIGLLDVLTGLRTPCLSTKPWDSGKQNKKWQVHDTVYSVGKGESPFGTECTSRLDVGERKFKHVEHLEKRFVIVREGILQSYATDCLYTMCILRTL
jgi:hypothetical protein